MKYIEFRNALEKYPVFGYSDIRKANPAFHRRRIVEWQKEGYIRKIRRGYYCFGDHPQGETFLYYIANYIYKPSYISLVSAFSYYNLIPEGVFTLSSVCTPKTTSFKSSFGNFEYKNIKPSLFFGYRLIMIDNYTIKMAEPEKMILDYCYFIKPDSIAFFEAIRMDKLTTKKLIDFNKLDSYLSIFSSATMNKRINIFKKYLYA